MATKTQATRTSTDELTVDLHTSIQPTVKQQSKNASKSIKKLHATLLQIYGILQEIYDSTQCFEYNNLHGWVALRICLQDDYADLSNQLKEAGFLPVTHWISDVYGCLAMVIDNTERLLGTPKIVHHHTHHPAPTRSNQLFIKQPKTAANIMVTMPTHAASEYEFMLGILGSGANYIRINTAHDTLKEWKIMARFAKVASIEARQPVKVYTDLASRKLRTGKIKRVFQPIPLAGKGERSRIIITKDTNAFTCIKESSHAIDGMATVVLSEELVDSIGLGNEIRVTDMRNKKRTIRIIDIAPDYCLGVIEKKTLIDSNSVFTLRSHKEHISSSPLNIRPQPAVINAVVGDTILISAQTEETHVKECPGNDASACIYLAITDPEVLEFVSVGDRLALDDGKIWMKVEEKQHESITCLVTFTKGESVEIKEEKGVNFPDSSLELPALTDVDKENLSHILEFTDIVGLSFCQTGEDVRELGSHIEELTKDTGKEKVGVVAKIETQKAVNNLPSILEALIERGRGGVMIARGDLAVEVGFTHLAKVQQHILDMCKAANIPVIYATGVMEKGMKKGLPTRAEVTDVYNARQADCLMINKGDYVNKNIEWIQNIHKDI